MTRPYQSHRRAEGAARTRQDIVTAALKLHAQGVTALNAVAKEAGVSLPTLQKHFPTRDDLFRACTAHSRTLMPPPPIDDLARIADPAERLFEIVRQVYAFHEIKLGYNWMAYKLEDESPVLGELLAALDLLVGRAVDALLQEWKTNVPLTDVEAMRGFACGLLSPLTFRALRLKGGLNLDLATRETALALSKMLGIEINLLQSR